VGGPEIRKEKKGRKRMTSSKGKLTKKEKHRSHNQEEYGTKGKGPPIKKRTRGEK